ncbi:MAG TPA: hypothetical protein DCE44_21055, partial [Verrucomicrobiales bacterium]|nr:hypothetical protein [Verrucomicrobiales bacterium]
MKRLAFTCLTLLFLHRAAAADSVVVFNEVNYHPVVQETTHEWIELYNQMAIDIDLSGWHIEDGVNFTFSEGTIIPAGGYLVIAKDPAAVKAATGLTTVLGPFAGSLSNAGEKLELRDRNDRLMDTMTYADGGKWPVAADGSGAVLAKQDPNSLSADPANWTSSVVVGGTPGARNFPEVDTKVLSPISLTSDWRFEASGTDLGTDWKESNFDDGDWSGENKATLVSYWPFDGNTEAARGTGGTFSGAVSPTQDHRGTASGALAFGGAGQYVNVTAGGGLNAATSGTIGLWVKWNATSQDADCCGSFGAILARQGDGLFSDNILALNAADPLKAKLVWRQSGGPAPILITGTTTVGAGWHHVAVTFSPDGSTLYLDGVAQGSAVGDTLHNNAAVP